MALRLAVAGRPRVRRASARFSADRGSAKAAAGAGAGAVGLLKSTYSARWLMFSKTMPSYPCSLATLMTLASLDVELSPKAFRAASLSATTSGLLNVSVSLTTWPPGPAYCWASASSGAKKRPPPSPGAVGSTPSLRPRYASTWNGAAVGAAGCSTGASGAAASSFFLASNNWLLAATSSFLRPRYLRFQL